MASPATNHLKVPLTPRSARGLASARAGPGFDPLEAHQPSVTGLYECTVNVIGTGRHAGRSR